jgi:hypothetical protein
MLADLMAVSFPKLHTHGQFARRGRHWERGEWTIETGQWKGRSPVDPPKGFGNTFWLAPVAPERAGQFDDRQLLWDVLQEVG